MAIEKLIETRKNLKKRKPDFVRQDFHKKRLSKRWKKPRGLQSKVRLKFRGKPKRISTGYGSPKKVRGFLSSGLKGILISSLKEIDNIQKETQAIIIKSSVGTKKRLELLKKAKENNIVVFNIKDSEKFIKKVEEDIKKRKDKKKKAKESADKKKKEQKGKKEEKLIDKLNEEDKKKEEKKEKDKVLTKKV